MEADWGESIKWFKYGKQCWGIHIDLLFVDVEEYMLIDHLLMFRSSSLN